MVTPDRVQRAPDRDLVVGDRQAADVAAHHQHRVVAGLRDGGAAQQLPQLLHHALLVLVAPVEVVGHCVLDDRAAEGELRCMRSGLLACVGPYSVPRGTS